MWSVPHQIARPGDLVDFGYEKHATIAVPLSSVPESATATVRYLVCRADSCIPGVAELSLSAGTPKLYELPTPVVAQRKGKVATVALPGVTQAEVFPDLVLAESGVSHTLVDGVLTLKLPASAHGTLLIRGKGKGGEVFYGVEL